MHTIISGYAQDKFTLTPEKDIPILGAGFLAGLSGYFLEKKVTPPTEVEILRLHPADINRFDRNAIDHYSQNAEKLSDITVTAGVLLPVSLIILPETRREKITLSVMYLEVLFFANSLPALGKGIIRRKRPYNYNPEIPLKKKLEAEAVKSFFSRHTSSAFASATFFLMIYGSYYPESPYREAVWISSLALASLTGYLRYASGEHFPTDIMAGAVVGACTGFFVPWIHRFNSENNIGLNLHPGKISLQFSF